MLNTDIWKSKQVSSLSMQARLLYVGLITFGDDDGRLNGDPALLRSMVFSRDENVTIADVSGWLDEIVSCGLVVKYAANGDDYLVHPNWTRYQTIRADRQKESNIPPPPDDILPTSMQPSGNQMTAKEKITKGKIREDKKREENTLRHFDEFWKAYPNKVAKVKALQSWKQIFSKRSKEHPEAISNEIQTGLERAKKSPQWTKDDGRYIPHPTTWLNQERWNDEIAVTSGRKTHKI